MRHGSPVLNEGQPYRIIAKLRKWKVIYILYRTIIALSRLMHARCDRIIYF